MWFLLGLVCPYVLEADGACTAGGGFGLELQRHSTHDSAASFTHKPLSVLRPVTYQKTGRGSDKETW